MKRTNYYTLSFALVVTCIFNGCSDRTSSPEAIALAKKLIALTGQAEAFTSNRQQKLSEFEMMINRHTNLDETASAELLQNANNIIGALSWENIEEQLAAEYVRIFSVPELQELIAIYQTPTFKKLLAKSPQLEKKGKEIIVRMTAEAGAASANANFEPIEVVVASPTGMQTVTVGKASITADDILNEMKKYDK